MIRFYQFLFFLLFTQLVLAQSATISGIIYDQEDFPLAFSEIEVVGNDLYLADENGGYSIELTAGDYELIFTSFDYKELHKKVTLVENQTLDLNIYLESVAEKNLNEVVIRADSEQGSESSLMRDVKESEVIKQNLGKEEMSRKGVGDVKQGLSKVTGVVFVENRGIIVRGLEDRYNNLLINHLAVPSNNPFKKIIALDLFPTDVVGKLEIFKTFNPDLYGDFGGALINVETTQPKKSFTKINFGFKYTTQNNLSNFVIDDNQTNIPGYFGNKTGKRELPSFYGNIPASKALYGQEAINTLSDGFNTKESISPISNNFGITHAGKIKNPDWRYIISANFENDYEKREGVERIFNLGQGNYDNNFNYSKYNYNTLFNTLGSLIYSPRRSHFQANLMYLKSTQSSIKDQLGVYNSEVINPNTFIRTNQLEEAQFLNGQLFGDFYLTDSEKHQMKMGISYTQTQYQQPDRKFLRGQLVEDNVIQTRAGGNNLLRQYLNLDGNYHFSGLAEYNLRFGDENKNRIAVGYNGVFNQMESSYRFLFGIPLGGSQAQNVSISGVDSYIHQELFNNRIAFQEESTAQYRNIMDQMINAAYINAFFNLSERFELNAGLRVENENRIIKYRNIYDSFNSPFSKLESDNLDFLPSLNTKYKINSQSNLRFAGSKTITKPVIMERFPLRYINADNTVSLGNELLEDSDNYNAEIKWELFPTRNEMFTVSAFGKYIQNPIERTFLPTANSGGQIMTFINSKDATVYGVELEALMGLDRIFITWDNVYLGMNASFLSSHVNVSDDSTIETFRERELQGAANWMVNADLRYDFKLGENLENTVNLVFGMVGKRIFAVGTTGFDNMYEMPVPKLDFVWNGNFSKNWGFKMAIKNILNPYYQIEQGSDNQIEITEKSLLLKDFREGVGFGLSLDYNF